MSNLEPYPLPELDNLSPELLRELEKRRYLNVYRMVMHTPEFAPAYMTMADALLKRSTLPPTLRELIILRVGYKYGAAYAAFHHERLARQVGLSEAAIAAAKDEADADVFTDDEKLIVELTDEILATHSLSAESRSRAVNRLTSAQLADFVFTVGFYQLVSNFVLAFAVPLET